MTTQPILSHYHVQVPVFSGPLDLLLHLIERHELDITAISLAAVTDQYLEQIEQLQEDSVERLSDFLVIAARLLVIKSRALLPDNPYARHTQEDEEDPAESLARQLRIYRRFKEVANWLAHREELGLRTYLRVAPVPKRKARLDATGLTVLQLAEALLGAVARRETKEESVTVAVEHRTVTIERQITRLRDRLRLAHRIHFEEILSSRTNWAEVSVTLMAVLELVKRREIGVRQQALFGPIEIWVETAEDSSAAA